MRLVIDMIRGLKASEALNILRFDTKFASAEAERVLKSAIANLNEKARNAEIQINEDEIYVKEAYSDVGPAMKRIQPAPMGRAYRIKKRTNHLTIGVAVPVEEELENELVFEEETEAVEENETSNKE